MLDIDCEHSTEWDYKGFENHAGVLCFSDWVKTLVTKINYIDSCIDKAQLLLLLLSKDRHKLILVNQSLEGLLMFTGAYSKPDAKFSHNRFEVRFDNSLPLDRIFIINHNQLNNLQAIPFIKDETDKQRTIGLKMLMDCSDDEINNYKRQLKGFIEIKNYGR